MLSSDSKEVVSSLGKEVEVCEVSSTQVAEFATSSSFATRERRSGRVMREPSISELAKKSAEDRLNFRKVSENVLN